MLEVVSYAGQNKHKQRMWHCKCDCGKTKIILGHCLCGGRTKSCGCLLIKDRRGKKYGRLTVIEYVKQSKFKVAMWRCRCDCGNIIVVDGTSLQSKNTKSCGCLRLIPKQKTFFNGVLRNTKQAAKNRGYIFELSKAQVKKLHESPCFYCGILPSNTRREKGIKETYVYSGIDRIENNKGYTIKNCVPCCIDCNKAKGTKELSEFLNWARRIVTHNELGYKHI